jgi:hypothetical protein
MRGSMSVALRDARAEVRRDYGPAFASDPHARHGGGLLVTLDQAVAIAFAAGARAAVATGDGSALEQLAAFGPPINRARRHQP